MNDLKKEGRKFIVTMEDIPVPMFCLGFDGRIIASNKSFCDLVGFEADELKSMNVTDVTRHGYNVKVFDHGSSVDVCMLHDYENEQTIARRDGSTLPVKIKSTLVYEKSGLLQHSLNVVQDISRQREAEGKFKESEIRFKALYEHAPFSVQLLDMNGRTLRVNAAWTELWQVDDDELANKVIGTPYSVLADKQLEAIGVAAQIKSAFHGKSAATPVIFYDPVLSGVQGRARWVTAYVHPIKDDFGKVTGVLLIHHDMTSHVEAKEELKQAKEAAEVSNRLKSAFLANMSHEIRTPLTAILGFNDLLKTPNLSEDIRSRYHEIIKRSGASLAHLIDDILELSLIESGALSINIIDINLIELIQDVFNLINLEAVSKNISLSLHVGPGAPEVVVSDPMRMKQILINLVGNAIKFTSGGFVSVSLSAPANAAQFAIAIEDSGIGISKKDQSKLFEPFNQVDNSNTRRYGGTGLGLALSRKLAQALGGDIRLLDSVPGKGSTFILTHPLAHSKKSSKQESVESFNGRNNISDANRPLAGMKILVVDDSIENRFLIEEMLRTYGASVETAESGYDGLEKAFSGQCDLVIMDIQMPGMDGFEATRELRRRGYHKPVIALTARVMKEDVERCYAAGCNAHAAKPVDFSNLVDLVRSYS